MRVISIATLLAVPVITLAALSAPAGALSGPGPDGKVQQIAQCSGVIHCLGKILGETGQVIDIVPIVGPLVTKAGEIVVDTAGQISGGTPVGDFADTAVGHYETDD
ncbi:hypothetical protein GCM10009555_019250 [Acrocarpospora macrocephala]|uniref:Secreted protein n=1 Tax=Acrocarpospora macrocephala TaxID=150177 RepID=A0A5M3WEQ2_9ACTN|nr:hypothetical protein [Acrocarpospora macrocephala]GES07585.1 hypothetical protein Amac_011800 [Acrocarpospora macrocephala]